MKYLLKKITPSFLISWYHLILSFSGAIFYGFPSRPALLGEARLFGTAKKLKVIGVTGTNGKSTVVDLTTRILEEAGYKTASLSSIKFKVGEKEWENALKMTMPGRFIIQKILRQAVNAGCQYAVLEVTSEGIKQHRHCFIDFETAIFTNLTPEHIESHGSFEKYRETKGKLFQIAKKIHILNLDDENIEYFLQFPSEKKYGYGLKTSNQSSSPNFQKIVAKNLQVLGDGIRFSIDDVEFNLKLLGEFNISNALAAIGVGLSQGVNLETCKKALEKAKGIPGRMEEVISEPFKVFVDYAFTPNALQKVYETLKTLIPKPYNLKPKLICVLGAAGGGRDKWKRPVLGEIAAKYCQEIIVTDEDPYDENPEAIINQVAGGAGEKARKILDRREAIRRALRLADEGDVVVITGKGCEPWICIADGKKTPWDDRRVVKEEFLDRN